MSRYRWSSSARLPQLAIPPVPEPLASAYARAAENGRRGTIGGVSTTDVFRTIAAREQVTRRSAIGAHSLKWRDALQPPSAMRFRMTIQSRRARQKAQLRQEIIDAARDILCAKATRSCRCEPSPMASVTPPRSYPVFGKTSATVFQVWQKKPGGFRHRARHADTIRDILLPSDCDTACTVMSLSGLRHFCTGSGDVRRKFRRSNCRKTSARNNLSNGMHVNSRPASRPGALESPHASPPGRPTRASGSDQSARVTACRSCRTPGSIQQPSSTRSLTPLSRVCGCWETPLMFF